MRAIGAHKRRSHNMIEHASWLLGQCRQVLQKHTGSALMPEHSNYYTAPLCVRLPRRV